MKRRQITKRIILGDDIPRYLEDIETGKKVNISPEVYDTLKFLSDNAGTSFTRDELAYEFWKEHWKTEGMDPSSITVRISHARKMLNEIFPGAGRYYIKTGRKQYKFVTDLSDSISSEVVPTSVPDISYNELESLMNELDLLMTRMEQIQEKINSATSLRWHQAYSQHLDALFMKYDQLQAEVRERYAQAEKLRMNMCFVSEDNAPHSTLLSRPNSIVSLSSWISSATTVVESIANELDDAIHQFLCGNIDNFQEIIDLLPADRQTTHALYELVYSYDLPELYEVLLTERRDYLKQTELNELCQRAKKIFISELWSLWDIDI